LKPNTIQEVHHVGVTEEDIRMSIDQASMVHIMQLLTDLYSDPRMAVIREYSTNAYDSNIEAGNPAPIIVTLPTEQNPHFTIQDNGVGLSVDDLKKVYSLYGASTKRDSNLVNGMLGLGCKSGLTYALSFNVTAVKGGVKTLAMVTKDNDGVGCINIMDTVGTDEPNGVRIDIPVQAHHISSFRAKAAEFYMYWRAGTVLIDGEEPDYHFENIGGDVAAVWLDDDIVVLKDGGGHGGSKIIMGNVAYPWNAGFSHTIIANVPIGSIDFTPSREALHETELTKSTCKTVLDFVTARFPTALAALVDQAPTAFERAKVLNEWRYVSSSITKGALDKYKDDLAVSYDRDRIVWLWDSYQEQASKVRPDWRYISQDDRVMIVTEFPFKSVSQSHRSRLRSVMNWIKPGDHVPRQTLIIPTGATTGVLQGRPNVLTWDEVVALTPAPPKEARATGTRVAKYTVVQNGRSEEKDVLDPKDGPIVWRRRLDPRQWNSQDHLAQMHSDVQMVKLYERQIEKFCKAHPTAVNLKEYHDAEVKKATKALTKDDKACLSAKERPWNSYNSQKILVELKDPDIKTILRLQKHRNESKTLARALHLSIAVEPDDTVYDRVLKRYPFISAIPYPDKSVKAELIDYINNKYTQLKNNGGI
jgi:hypothetical protein